MRRAQQLEQRQQLQRARAAPWDPAVRVEVDAECASMPPRTTVHTCAVNSMTVMWDTIHLIRGIWPMGGLRPGTAGHMGHIRAGDEPCATRSNARASFSVRGPRRCRAERGGLPGLGHVSGFMAI
ncbi:hypothetical protein FRZ03_19575 [Streptomyces misionensis]|uniref:Uncharacterized protein n=1 Tax=Streptomyces misionensis TaxID=67331 RepID=A0A5C6JMG3_9ACTN|nr:hypothetical protein FRZ03_19575 [Streptomyces misionensis]